MERECNKCIHHTSGTCSSWDCKMQTVEDVKREAREKAIAEFAEAVKELVNAWGGHCPFGTETVDEIAKELKKNSNETQTEVKGE